MTRQVAHHLSNLEAIEADHYPDSTLRIEEPETALAEIGVPSGYRRNSDDGGLIYLTPKGPQWWMGSEHVNAAVDTAINDNLGKLKGPHERHLFLWIEFHALSAFMQMRDGELPKAAPRLQDSVDCVWVCPAHPLKDQQDLPIWKCDGEAWARTATPIPEILLKPE